MRAAIASITFAILYFSACLAGEAVAPANDPLTQPHINLHPGDWVEWQIQLPPGVMEQRAAKTMQANILQAQMDEEIRRIRNSDQKENEKSNDKEKKPEKTIQTATVKPRLPKPIHCRLRIVKVHDTLVDITMETCLGTKKLKAVSCKKLDTIVLGGAIPNTPHANISTGNTTLQIGKEKLKVNTYAWQTGRGSERISLERWSSKKIPFGPAHLQVGKLKMTVVGYGRLKDTTPSFPITINTLKPATKEVPAKKPLK